MTLPSDTKATVKMETQNGSIYSDFEIQMNASPREPKVEDVRKGGGKFRVVTEKARFGSINGGGPEFRFKTVNGNIHIRKGSNEDECLKQILRARCLWVGSGENARNETFYRT